MPVTYKAGTVQYIVTWIDAERIAGQQIAIDTFPESVAD